MKIYFARPLSNYKSLQDLRDLELIQKLGFEIINPDKDEFTRLYKEKGFQIFNDAVKECDGLIFRSFVDGKIGSGVASEIQTAREEGLFILELPTITSNRILNIEDTREYLKLLGQR